MELWKFGGNKLKMHLLEMLNNSIEKSNTTKMGNRNGDKHI